MSNIETFPDNEYKPVKVGDKFASTRKGSKITALVYVRDVKRHKVKLANSMESKDSWTESRAHLDRYFEKVNA